MPRNASPAPLPAPVVVPWYADRPDCSYECRGFPGGDYGAETFEDARLWLALDPPPAGSEAVIVELAPGARGKGIVERIVWPISRFGEGGGNPRAWEEAYRSARHRGGGNSGKPRETVYLLWSGAEIVVSGWRL